MAIRVVQCWVPDGCTAAEAMNNSRLLRFTPFEDKQVAERYLETCKARKEPRFIYWLESKT